MAVPRVFVLALPVAAGAVAWIALAGDMTHPPRALSGEPGVERPATPGVPPHGSEAFPPRPAPSPEPDVPEDPEWITRRLPSLRGTGPLRGGDLIDAVEKAGPLRFRGATDADLGALRRAVLEDVDREATPPYAAMMGWLKEAGFEVEVAYPVLTVRRRTDEDGAGR